ncbi:TetR/AcrR family transcriptional regulator [Rhodococcus sp. HNM0569]|uniref:TetR family transcriptional regulator n=1 Tax=Rhodococcus sp. HNM0569 TaxID=2716340 RepID=UPI00146DE114|nr:TetR/AcrR family transcriptional regulator [Rhodococcus sp. HNM0569]
MPGPQPLTRERIRDATLRLVDEFGLDAVSMRKIAAALGVQAPSLYAHYPAKDDVLRDIAQTVADQVDVSAFADGWRAGVLSWARSYRAAMVAHPNMVPYLAFGPSDRAGALDRADAVFGGLTAGGWPPRRATMISASIKYLVVGSAISSFSSGFPDEKAVYEGRYPHLGQAHLLRERAGEIDQDSFELALTALVEGLGHPPSR